MPLKLRPALVELVVSDMAATLAFYRRLGLEIAADGDTQPHVDILLDGGIRLAFDSREIRSLDPEWSRPVAAGIAWPWPSTAGRPPPSTRPGTS